MDERFNRLTVVFLFILLTALLPTPERTVTFPDPWDNADRLPTFLTNRLFILEATLLALLLVTIVEDNFDKFCLLITFERPDFTRFNDVRVRRRRRMLNIHHIRMDNMANNTMIAPIIQ